MTNDYERWSKLANTPEKKAILDFEFERYRQGYIKRELAYLNASSRTMSSMITGPSNFPTARNKKRLDTAHKRMTEAIEFRNKAKRAITRKLTDSEAIKTEDPEAVTKLKKKLSDVLNLSFVFMALIFQVKLN